MYHVSASAHHVMRVLGAFTRQWEEHTQSDHPQVDVRVQGRHGGREQAGQHEPGQARGELCQDESGTHGIRWESLQPGVRNHLHEDVWRTKAKPSFVILFASTLLPKSWTLPTEEPPTSKSGPYSVAMPGCVSPEPASIGHSSRNFLAAKRSKSEISVKRRVHSVILWRFNGQPLYH